MQNKINKELSSFWNNYDKHYKRMGNIPPSLIGEKNTTIEQFSKSTWLPKSKNVKILDIGFGWGNLLMMLWILGYHDLYGVEVSPNMFVIAQKNLPKEIDIQCDDAINYLKTSQKTFDQIIIFDVIEHMSINDASLLLRSCYKNLNLGGNIVLRTPNLANLLAPYIIFSDNTHKQGYTEWSLFQLLDESGFSDHKIIKEKDSGFTNWKENISLRHPLAGLNLEKILSTGMHELLYRLHPQIPRPSVYDFNIIVQSDKK